MRGFRVGSAVLGVVLAAGGAVSGEDYGFKVIVNSANPVTSITRTELASIFLKQETSWSDGQVALPVDQGENSSVRADFSRAVLRRPVAAVKSFWQKQIFSGSAVPPVEKNSNEDVVGYVGAFHGAVGYVAPMTSISSGVKVIRLAD